MDIRKILLLPALVSIAVSVPILAKDKKEETNPLASIPLRNIGPAMISGRISDFAFPS